MKHSLPLILLIILTTCFTVPARSQQQTGAISDHQYPIESRYIGSVEMGYLYGKIKNNFNSMPTYMASPSILVFNGYRAHRSFAIGAATGIDFYENIVITPLGLGIRGTISDKRVRPFYSLDAGYGSSFLSAMGYYDSLVNGNFGRRPEGGWFINPSIGLQVNIDSRNAFQFGIGFKRQRAEIEENNVWGIITHEIITFKRLSFRMGFVF